MPSMASDSCHMTSGCSGLPKLRQFTTAMGRAPTQARFSTASATTRPVPARGSTRAPAVVAVGREGQPATGVGPGGRVLEAQQHGVAARADHRVEEQLVVVLAPDPRACRTAGRGARLAGRADRSRPPATGRAGPGRAARAAGRTAGRRRGGWPRARRRAPARRTRRGCAAARRGRPASVTRPMTVARTSHRAQRSSTSPRPSGVTMASIRSWLSLVITSNGSMPGSRHGTADTSTSMPDAAARRGLAGRAGEAGAAEVLDADDEAGVEQGQARLDEPLLLERVAHLHGRPLVVVALLEAGRGQHRHATDAVTPGGRAEQHREVADARRLPEHEALVGQGARGRAR